MGVGRQGAVGTVAYCRAQAQETVLLSSSSLLPFGLISSGISRDTGNTDFYVSLLPFKKLATN